MAENTATPAAPKARKPRESKSNFAVMVTTADGLKIEAEGLKDLAACDAKAEEMAGKGLKGEARAYNLRRVYKISVEPKVQKV